MKNGLKESSDASHKKIGEIVEDVQVAMLTTYNQKGKLSSRPMQVQEIDKNGVLWFFSNSSTKVVKEINNEAEVNLIFTSAKKNEYLTATGLAEENHDKEKMKELWNPIMKAWFKEGLDSPGICLIKIELDEVEYWDSPNSTVVQLAGFIKAMVSDATFKPGEHKSVDLKH